MNAIRRVLLLGYSHDIYEIIRRENTSLSASLMLVLLSFLPSNYCTRCPLRRRPYQTLVEKEAIRPHKVMWDLEEEKKKNSSSSLNYF